MDFRHADNPTPFSKMRAEMRAERTIGAKVLGVGRCAEWPNVLEVYFDKAPSDDDLRRIHDLLRSNRRAKGPADCGRSRLSAGLCETERRMDINQQGPTSPEEYETALFAAKFAMTNEELDKAIDTAARHSGTTCGRLMFDHLQKLLAIQYARAGVVRVSVEKVDADETAHNVPSSPAGAASCASPRGATS